MGFHLNKNLNPKCVEPKTVRTAATNMSVVPVCNDRWVWSIGEMAKTEGSRGKSATAFRPQSDKTWGLNGSGAQGILLFS